MELYVMLEKRKPFQRVHIVLRKLVNLKTGQTMQ